MMTSDTVSRYPLSWPRNWKRTSHHARTFDRFSTKRTIPSNGGGSYTRTDNLTVAEAIARLIGELARLGATNIVISTNVRTRNDGLPRSGEKNPDDPGAAVYFKINKQDRCLACDKYRAVQGNLAALAAHVEALRAIERHGVGTLDQAFAGYTAIGHAATDWRLELGFGPHELVSPNIVDARYKTLARERHPDAGGSVDLMARLNVARDEARKDLGV